MKKEPETTPSTSTTRRRSVLATGARDDEFGSSTGEERPGEDVKPVAKPEPKKRKRQQPSKPDEPKSVAIPLDGSPVMTPPLQQQHNADHFDDVKPEMDDLSLPSTTPPPAGRNKRTTRPSSRPQRTAQQDDEGSGDDEDVKPSIPSSPEYSPSPLPKNKRAKGNGKQKRKASDQAMATTSSTTANAAQPIGPWTPAKRAIVAKHIVERGLTGLDYAELSAMAGVSPTQLRNALQKGHKSNIRDKLLRFAEEL